jgi:hypothetical protein
MLEGVLWDNVLYLAHYSRIASGVRLYAYYLPKEQLLWECDVKQPLVEHSKYWNRVYLTCFENKIILEGQEAYAQHLQVFDAKTGKRLFEK